MGIRTRRARTRSRTHIVSFSIAGFFGFIALFVMAMFLSVGALVTNWLSELPDYSSANALSSCSILVPKSLSEPKYRKDFGQFSISLLA